MCNDIWKIQILNVLIIQITNRNDLLLGKATGEYMTDVSVLMSCGLVKEKAKERLSVGIFSHLLKTEKEFFKQI